MVVPSVPICAVRMRSLPTSARRSLEDARARCAVGQFVLVCARCCQSTSTSVVVFVVRDFLHARVDCSPVRLGKYACTLHVQYAPVCARRLFTPQQQCGAAAPCVTPRPVVRTPLSRAPAICEYTTCAKINRNRIVKTHILKRVRASAPGFLIVCSGGSRQKSNGHS